MVDNKKIAITPALELSYLKPEEQAFVVDTIESEQATPSLSQAQRMKKKSQAGELNEDIVLSIMSEEKKSEKYDLTISGDTLLKYFPRSYTPADAGHHHKAAGGVAAQTPAQPGALKISPRVLPDCFCLAFFVPKIAFHQRRKEERCKYVTQYE